jgi:hypothetical protein
LQWLLARAAITPSPTLGAVSKKEELQVKHSLASCLAVFAVTILPDAALADGITYDCDTAANHYSELVLPAPAGPFTVRGKIQLNALAEVTKYTPLARAWISSPTQPGQSPESFAGVSVMGLPVDAHKYPTGSPAIQMVAFNVSGKEDEIEPLSMLVEPGGPQSFSLSFDGKNVSAAIGNDGRVLPVKTSAPVVRLICSTGEFLFTNVTIQSSR